MKGTRPGRGPRALAVWTVDRVFRTGAYADILLDRALDREALEPQDRALATELVYGTLRWWKKLNWILERSFKGEWLKVPEGVRRILEVALYQILYLERVPAYAAVDEAVAMASAFHGRTWGRMVNAVLRNLLRHPELHTVPAMPGLEALRISIDGSHPLWLVEAWLARFGAERTEAVCRANNVRPGLGLRVNRRAADREGVLSELAAAGMEARPFALSEDFLIVAKTGSVKNLEGLRAGRYTVQDPSAGFAARLVDPQPGERILDIAAAPGGKTTHMAELSGDQAVIIAADVRPGRLRKVIANRQRLGLSCIHAVAVDAGGSWKTPFDKVLLDAPCTGLGTVRRRPEIRWFRKPEDVRSLTAAQDRLLDAAAGLVRPAGVLVFSTCTVLDEENAGSMRRFLERHAEFEIQNASGWVPPAVVDGRGFVETWPDLHGVDGSFAARFKKKG
jgi:16S rRNA (cytosine967-C5)-methyltransferase